MENRFLRKVAICRERRIFLVHVGLKNYERYSFGEVVVGSFMLLMTIDEVFSWWSHQTSYHMLRVPSDIGGALVEQSPSSPSLIILLSGAHCRVTGPLNVGCF